MIPGEIFYGSGDIEMNAAALSRLQMRIINAGDRPVQVGSHVHLPQANRALSFDRATAHGYRLDIPAATAVRFEPGIPQIVGLVPLGGRREVPGLTLNPPGRLDRCWRDCQGSATHSCTDLPPATGYGWPTPTCWLRSPKTGVGDRDWPVTRRCSAAARCCASPWARAVRAGPTVPPTP